MTGAGQRNVHQIYPNHHDHANATAVLEREAGELQAHDVVALQALGAGYANRTPVPKATAFRARMVIRWLKNRW